MPRGKTVGLNRGTEERGGGRPARPAGLQHRGQRRPLVDVAPHAPLSLNFTAETPEEKMIESGVGSSPHPRFKTYGFKRISRQARDYYCHRDPFPGSQRQSNLSALGRPGSLPSADPLRRQKQIQQLCSRTLEDDSALERKDSLTSPDTWMDPADIPVRSEPGTRRQTP